MRRLVAILDQIGPPFERLLTEAEYRTICDRLRALGGEPVEYERHGAHYHEWISGGRVILVMYRNPWPRGEGAGSWRRAE